MKTIVNLQNVSVAHGEQHPSPIFQCFDRRVYRLGGVYVSCWLCEGLIPDTMPDSVRSALGYTHSVVVYSIQNGIISLDFKSLSEALEVFALLTRYEISPYHIEDVLEDRELVALIRRL